MDKAIKEDVKDDNIWMKGLYLMLFGFIFSISEMVIFAIVVVQFLFIVFKNEKNQNLLKFSNDLNQYIFSVLQFLTFNSQFKPFPFSEWNEHKSN